jgi:ribosomal protein S18 acetylase RimI-like enzyme
MYRKILSEKIGARLTLILGRVGDYRMALLGHDYLNEVMTLQRGIIRELSRKDMLQPFPRAFMREHIGEKGQIIGVFLGSKLIAFRNIYFPSPDDPEWNLGIDIGIEGDDLKRVANLQMVCVHPDHRGKSLAFKMNSHVINILRELKTHRYLCATVSPFNYWNVRILLNCGFVIKKLKDKYSGKLRYVVYQDLTHPLVFSSRNSRSVNLVDFPRQKTLLAEGYCGTTLRQVPEFHTPLRQELPRGFELVFQFPVSS